MNFDIITSVDYGRSIVALANTILKHFGLPVRRYSLPSEISSKILNEKVILVLIDGVSYQDFLMIVKSSDTLSKYVDLVDKLYSVFPPTTPTALTSFSYAVEPGIHGILGTTMYFRECGYLVNMLSLTPIGFESQKQFQLNLGYVVQYENIFRELADSGIRVHVYLPKGSESGLSRIIYRGVEHIEYSCHIDALVNSIQSSNEYDYYLSLIYIPYPDQVAHKYGVNSIEYATVIEELLNSIIKVCSKYINKPTTLIIFSDHGLIPCNERDEINLKKFNYIIENIAIPPYGDMRSSNIKFIDSSCINEFKSTEDYNYLSKYFIIMTRDELVSSNLLGEVSDEVVKRIGDVVLISKSSKYVRYEYLVEKERQVLKSHHGGLVVNEVEIPLLILNY